MEPAMKNRTAFVLLDVIAGIALLAALSTVLVVAANSVTLNAGHLAEQRAASNEVQSAMAKLQSGEKLDDPNITIRHIGPRVGNREWIEVNATRDGHHASLIGLAPPTTQPEELK
jgi:hypothetical protein